MNTKCSSGNRGTAENAFSLLEDVPGALWKRGLLEESRWPAHRKLPDFTRIVVAIDPAATSGEDADETGIIVAAEDIDGRGYVLADRSGRMPPIEWARAAISAYHSYGADRIVAEVNNGGDMVENTIRMVESNVSYAAVHASRGKVVRAEPVAALYEQGKIHHTTPETVPLAEYVGAASRRPFGPFRRFISANDACRQCRTDRL